MASSSSAASLLSNYEWNHQHQSREPKRKKRRKVGEGQRTQDIQATKWRTPSEQKAYTSNLYEALRQVRRNTSPADTDYSRGRAVHAAADRALAVAARGRTRWSRAILSNRLSFIRRGKHKRVVSAAARVGRGESDRMLRSKERAAVLMKKSRRPPPPPPPAIHRRLRVLGDLVPGCRKVSFSNIMKEAVDYIPALEMQVKAMAQLVEVLASAGAQSGSAGASHGF